MTQPYDVEKYGKVEKHVVELLAEYDVTDKNFCVNEQPRKIKDVFKVVESQLSKDLLNEFDYWGASYPFDQTFNKEAEFPKFHWLAIYHVTGGSEGHWVHVAAITDEDKHIMLWLAKTLHEQDGPSWCEKLIAELNRIIKP